MSADINRKSLDPKETHFSQMLFHQGRVMLPSDLNESGAIFQYYLRQFITDFVGKRWRTDGSFEISNVKISDKTFNISTGHFYVDGILCVNEVNCVYSPTDNETVQPMFPTPEWGKIKDLPKDFAAYLECWERHVNWIQRPQIRDVALGGRDTSSRLEIAWQVRVLTEELANNYVNDITEALEKRSPQSDKTITTIKDTFKKFKDGLGKSNADHCNDTQNLLEILDDADPKLRVWAKKSADAADPCSISPDAHYRGLENQLYRVEIHDSTSFKWSRENGSVVFRIVSEIESSTSTVNGNDDVVTLTLNLDTLGRDHRYGLCVNDWVELTNDRIEFSQTVLPLAQVIKIDPSQGRIILTVKSKDKVSFSDCTLLRRWDQKDGVDSKSGTIKIRENKDNEYRNYDSGSWIKLERGIKILFDQGGNYRKGDYWIFPARVETGDVEWPNDDQGIPQPRSTDGIKRHRAALAVVVSGNEQGPHCGCMLEPICK